MKPANNQRGAALVGRGHVRSENDDATPSQKRTHSGVIRVVAKTGAPPPDQDGYDELPCTD